MSKSRRYYGLVVCSSYLTLGSPASRRLADIVTFPGLQEVVGVNSGGKSSVSRVKKGALWAARNRDDFRMADSATRQRRLWEAYAFPGFRPHSAVSGVFGDPKSRVLGQVT